MLMLHDGTPEYKNNIPDLDGEVLPSHVAWIDILNGNAEEIAFVERVIKRHLPTCTELNEIESSSRLQSDHDAFCLSAPIVSHIPSGMPETTSVGFILTKSLFVTVRFAPLAAFTSFEAEYNKADTAYSGNVGAFVGLMNAIVDRCADVLEEVGSELDQISQGIFGEKDKVFSKSQPPARESASLRETLRRIGYNGDLSSKIRNSLLGIGRIISYVNDMGAEWVPVKLKAHLKTQFHDIASLSDYDVHLMNKVQLLLDATMGLINIEQNNIIKVLTVVSVVGVPPTLVASIYGMNFRHMPELDWSWGYPYGLAIIALSAIAPLVWFRVRGWL